MTEIADHLLMNPFITEAAADIDLYPLLPGRNGRTREGRILYWIRQQSEINLYIKFRHLMEGVKPSYKQ